MDVRVKGGTTPSSWDAHLASMVADHKSRLAEQDKDIQASQMGVEQGGGIRKTMDLGQPGTNPVVIFEYSNGPGHHGFIQADITVTQTEAEPILSLVIVCPECVKRGVPQAQAQMLIRSNHRKWYLDEKCKGQVFKEPGTGSVYVVAGKVHGPDLYKCSQFNCTYAFRISENSTYSEYPMISRLVAE